MPGMPRPNLVFGPFELRRTPAGLFREGQPISITPKALATLIVLVSKPGTAVSKEELLATVWGETAVEESNLSQNIYTLRKLLAADFPDGNAIENIPRFGYRFTPAVSERAPEVLPTDEDEEAEARGHGAGDMRAIAAPAPAEGAVRSRPRWAWWAVATTAVLLICVMALLWPTWMRRVPHFEISRFTSNLHEDKVSAVAISPDGTLVAYADEDGVVLRGTMDAALHLLPSPKLRAVDQLSWFPDQLHLLLSGVNNGTGVPEVWKVSVLREAPVLFRSGARLAVASHTGESVALTTADGSQLWVMGPNGEGSRQVASARPGARFSVLLWNLADDGILVQRRSVQPGNESAAFDSTESAATTGYEHIRLRDGRTTASEANILMGDACLTASGNLIYSQVIGAAERESTLLREVPIATDTGALGTPRDIVRVPEIDPHIHAFSCTKAGDRIAAIRIQGAIGVFVGTLNAENTTLTDVRRLSLDSDVAYAHGWTRDSRAVLYEARRTQGKWQIFSQALDKHDPELIVAMNGSETRPTLTPDGKWLLFNYQQDKFGTRALYRVDPAGGMPSPVPGIVGVGNYRCPIRSGTCVLLSGGDNSQAVFSVLDPSQGRGREVFRLPLSYGTLGDWDLSPDGTALVLTTVARPDRLFTVSLVNGVMAEVPFHSAAQIRSVNWTARGDGFFAATAASTGEDLSFVDVHGKATVLRTISTSTWAVPSPDGKYLAFNDRNVDSNVWLLDRK